MLNQDGICNNLKQNRLLSVNLWMKSLEGSLRHGQQNVKRFIREIDTSSIHLSTLMSMMCQQYALVARDNGIERCYLPAALSCFYDTLACAESVN